MKKIIRKLKSKAGESLVESMAAILIFTLSSIALLSMISASADINRTAKVADEQFQKQKEESEKNGTAKGSSSEKGYAGKGAPRSCRSSGKKPGARFHDFEQRNYDYDELLKQINSAN